jgi:peroxiredoxin (alkyl hydroperoxide reductase subunit C)
MKITILAFILTIAFSFEISAQKGESQRIPLIGTKAPSFKAPTTNGIMTFPGDFGEKWKILFAHPRDFTPVCSSEILELAYRQEEFKKLETEIAILSVDKMVSHKSWKADLESIKFRGREKVEIEFPLIVDSSSVISYKYGMLDSNASVGQSVRGVFFIDPENKIRAFHFYPSEVGRNVDEIIRTLKALQTHDQNKNIVLPVNWQPGDDYMLPFLTPEDKEELKKPDSEIYYINWYMIYKRGK